MISRCLYDQFYASVIAVSTLAYLQKNIGRMNKTINLTPDSLIFRQLIVFGNNVLDTICIHIYKVTSHKYDEAIKNQ